MVSKLALDFLAYETVKSQLLNGAFRPGEHVTPRDIAKKLAISSTPVVIALHRLAAERMLERSEGEGFSVPRLSGSELRELYHTLEVLLVDGLEFAQPSPPAVSVNHDAFGASDAMARSTWHFFRNLLGATGRPVYLIYGGNINDRLQPYRIHKDSLLNGRDRELQNLSSLWAAADFGGLTKALREYYQRRQAVAERIAQNTYK